MQILDSPHHFLGFCMGICSKYRDLTHNNIFWLLGSTLCRDRTHHTIFCSVLHMPVFTVQRQNLPHHFLLIVHRPVFTLQRQDSPHHFLFSYTQACVHFAERQDSLHHFLFSSTQACVHHAETGLTTPFSVQFYTGLCSLCRERGLTKPFSVGFYTGLCSWRKGGLEDCRSNDLSCWVPKTHTESPKALETRRITLT